MIEELLNIGDNYCEIQGQYDCPMKCCQEKKTKGCFNTDLTVRADSDVEGEAVPMSDISNPIGVVSPEADLDAHTVKSGLADTRVAGVREEAHSKAGSNHTGMPNRKASCHGCIPPLRTWLCRPFQDRVQRH